MRACRSSIMVGKALTETGMQRVVRHMGEIERPWNCPHGRPTMRHLSRLDKVGGWSEWGTQWNVEEADPGDEDAETGDGVWMPSSSQVEGGKEIMDEGRLWREWMSSRQDDDVQEASDDGNRGHEEDDSMDEQ